MSNSFTWLVQWASFSGKTITFNQNIPENGIVYVKLVDDNSNTLSTLTWVANGTSTITVSGTAPNVASAYIAVSVKDQYGNTRTTSWLEVSIVAPNTAPTISDVLTQQWT